jgi:hypothetical protein
VSDLFAEHVQRHEQLERLAERLLAQSSLLDLHAWYKSSDVLRAAAEDAEAAALILLGKGPG